MINKNPPIITVIIPTVASVERAVYLRRAIRSIRAQSTVTTHIIIVANGSSCDASLLAELSQQSGIEILHLPEGNLPAALTHGKKYVQTEFFTELDDDDYLLKNALTIRLHRMRAHPTAAAIISNGYLQRNQTSWLSIPEIDTVRSHPLRSLLERNWMLPGCALFRTSEIENVDFSQIPTYLEWTYLGLLLTAQKKVIFDCEPSFVHFEGHCFSVDQSDACVIGRVNAIKEIISRPWLPQIAKHAMRKKLSQAYHCASDLHLRKSRLLPAFKAHLSSLVTSGGWRYLSYTRHLVLRGYPREDQVAPTKQNPECESVR